MISEHWKTQPRDERGRWTDEQGFFRTNTSYKTLLKIPLTFFSESGLEKQSDNQLKKGIRSKEKRIREHKGYIENPYIKYPEWDSFDDDRKERELKHWRKEIMTHRLEIKERENLLERRSKDEE